MKNVCLLLCIVVDTILVAKTGLVADCKLPVYAAQGQLCTAGDFYLCVFCVQKPMQQYINELKAQWCVVEIKSVGDFFHACDIPFDASYENRREQRNLACFHFAGRRICENLFRTGKGEFPTKAETAWNDGRNWSVSSAEVWQGLVSASNLPLGTVWRDAGRGKNSFFKTFFSKIAVQQSRHFGLEGRVLCMAYIPFFRPECYHGGCGLAPMQSNRIHCSWFRDVHSSVMSSAVWRPIELPWKFPCIPKSLACLKRSVQSTSPLGCFIASKLIDTHWDGFPNCKFNIFYWCSVVDLITILCNRDNLVDVTAFNYALRPSYIRTTSTSFYWGCFQHWSISRQWIRDKRFVVNISMVISPQHCPCRRTFLLKSQELTWWMIRYIFIEQHETTSIRIRLLFENNGKAWFRHQASANSMDAHGVLFFLQHDFIRFEQILLYQMTVCARRTLCLPSLLLLNDFSMRRPTFFQQDNLRQDWNLILRAKR